MQFTSSMNFRSHGHLNPDLIWFQSGFHPDLPILHQERIIESVAVMHAHALLSTYIWALVKSESLLLAYLDKRFFLLQ